LWGLGFAGRDLDPDLAEDLISFFHAPSDPAYAAHVLGGVSADWRSFQGGASADPGWNQIYRSLDILSPWSVGRYTDDAGVESYRSGVLEGDLAETAANGVDYLPVVWPGFSWANLFKGQPLNQIPRRGGRLFWKQVYEFVDAGATMLYGAMFDEVDEGTAFFKIASSSSEAPSNGHFLTLDADGESLPSDFYLQLAGSATEVLRGEAALSSNRPLGSLQPPTCDPPESVLEVDRCVPSCGKAGGNSCDPVLCEGHMTFESYDCAVCCDLDF
jgi:hypothetical protein